MRHSASTKMNVKRLRSNGTRVRILARTFGVTVNTIYVWTR